MEKFPFGENASEPSSFLGRFDAKSKRWLISYWGGESLIAGYHSFIFLGLDNLNIARVVLDGVGANAAWGAKRLGRTARQSEIIDSFESLVNNRANEKSRSDLAKAEDDPGALYKAMMEESVPHYVSANIPFSLWELTQGWGYLEGFNVDIYIGGAQVYWLTFHNKPRFIYSDKKYLIRERLANLGGESIGVGIGSLFGQFQVKYHSLYHALGKSGDVNDRPYRLIPNVHPYIAELPPANSVLAAPQSALDRLNILDAAQ